MVEQVRYGMLENWFMVLCLYKSNKDWDVNAYNYLIHGIFPCVEHVVETQRKKTI